MWIKRLLKFGRLGALPVVLDTNVLISGTLVRAGMPARILRAVDGGWLRLVTCPALLDEYADVIRRPHVAGKYNEISQRATDLLSYAHERGRVVSGIPHEPFIPADPDDDMVIATALEGRAAYIVSGDKHLLELKQFRGIRILNPRDFVVQVLKEPTPHAFWHNEG